MLFVNMTHRMKEGPYQINVVVSSRTQQDTYKSFCLMGYFGESGVAFDSSRLENYPTERSPGEVGAFINGTFVACDIIMNNSQMDRLVREIRESQLVEIALI